MAIIHEAVFHGFATRTRVRDQMREVAVVVDQLALEWALEQRPCTGVRLVERLGIGDKKVVQLATRVEGARPRSWRR